MLKNPKMGEDGTVLSYGYIPKIAVNQVIVGYDQNYHKQIPSMAYREEFFMIWSL